MDEWDIQDVVVTPPGGSKTPKSRTRKSPDCELPSCDLQKKKGARFCYAHNNRFSCLGYRQMHGPGGSAEKKKAWVDKCKDEPLCLYAEIEKDEV